MIVHLCWEEYIPPGVKLRRVSRADVGRDLEQLARVRARLELDDPELQEILASTRGAYHHRALQRVALELAGRAAWVDADDEPRRSRRGWWIRGPRHWYRPAQNALELAYVFALGAHEARKASDVLSSNDRRYARAVERIGASLARRGVRAHALSVIAGMLRATPNELRPRTCLVVIDGGRA